MCFSVEVSVELEEVCERINARYDAGEITKEDLDGVQLVDIQAEGTELTAIPTAEAMMLAGMVN